MMFRRRCVKGKQKGREEENLRNIHGGLVGGWPPLSGDDVRSFISRRNFSECGVRDYVIIVLYGQFEISLHVALICGILLENVSDKSILYPEERFSSLVIFYELSMY